MPIAPRGIHFLGGLGSIGPAGFGVAGWQVWEEANPTGHKRLSSQGYSWNVPTPALGTENRDVLLGLSSGNDFLFQDGGCFQNFFPGAGPVAYDLGVTTVTISNISEMPGIPEGLPKGGESAPKGCVLMQMSNLGTREFILKSELTIKNHDFGLALWTGSKRLVDESQTSGKTVMRLKYYLLFLEKKLDKWSIKGGYSWDDSGLAGTGQDPRIYVATPKGDVWWNRPPFENTSTALDTSLVWEHKKYVGVWESRENNAEDKEFLGAVETWVSWGDSEEKDVSVEILGKSSNSTFSSRNGGCNVAGYNSAMSAYVDGGWKSYSMSHAWTGKDIGPDLDKLWQPFKDKKGEWTHLQEDNFCSSLSSVRNPSDTELSKLKSFCYRLKS